MKIVICWTHISGYMSACWRALTARGEFDLQIIGFKSDVPGINVAFADDVVRGLNVRLLNPDEQRDAALVRSLVSEERPAAVVVPGWGVPSYRALAREPALAGAKLVMTMDTPFRGTLRQRLGRYRMAGYLGRMSRVVVPGERAWQLARALGVPEHKIRRGLYGVDYATLAPLIERRRQTAGGWPRRFLYIGRYEHVKGIDILLDAYSHYRAASSDPWPLTCCGSGAMRDAIRAQEGAQDLGFVQPQDQPDVFATHGVFVLASRFDPWPLVVPEACAAGLPVVHSEACGSAVELVRPLYTGLGVATGDAQALASALSWCHDNHARLPDMGARAQPLAQAYSADAWAERWSQMFRELT